MKKTQSTQWSQAGWNSIVAVCAALALIGVAGCGGGKTAKNQKSEFFTSGSREADQRASQRMAQNEQLTQNGEGSAEKGAKKASGAASEPGGSSSSTNKGARVEGKLSLYDRLGGTSGLSNIVADFTPRALDDPRVNWERKGVKRTGLFHTGKSTGWNPAPENVAILQQHMVEFLALATGGPARYTGKDIQATHADMHITNPEFDAVIGDLKASLDRLKIPNTEQKELLSIIESTRPQIVAVR